MDWRNREEYLNHWKSLSPKYRAWEFLRRSSEYRSLWEKESAKAKLPDGQYKVDWWITGYEQALNGEMVLAADDPNLALSIPKEIQDRWRVYSLIPPWLDEPIQLNFTEDIQHLLKCELDLSMPIEPQLEKLGKIAKRYQRLHYEKVPNKPKWNPTDNHAEYLRLLDASNTGLQTKELAQIFFPKEDNTQKTEYAASKKITGQLKIARRIAERGYILFVKPHNW